MTSIEQLQISGIRSFDPNPAKKQVIDFQKPLTVILGKNGAGKTTIIEALLNACTGAMPPGSGAEKSSFVYDPKVVGASEVKAQIRLVFTGKGGKLMQVIRSFQVARTRNKISFTTLDNTIAYQDTVTRKVTSSTYRASDVDRVVPEMLGVSPAVLEHVIFCHQEDCNWPLAPPKDVKRIFDDIFAATRYVLALDRFRENSKEFRRQQKEHEASLLALREHRDQAKQLQTDIEAKEERVRAFEGRNRSIEPELKELLSVSAALDAVEQNIEDLARRQSSIQGRMGEKRDRIAKAGLPEISQTLEQVLEVQRGLAEEASQADLLVKRKMEQLSTATQSARQEEGQVYQLRSQLNTMERDDRVHKQEAAALRELLASVGGDGDEWASAALAEGSVDERALSRMMTSATEAVAQARQAVYTAATDTAEALRNAEEERQVVLRSRDAEDKEREVLGRLMEGIATRIQETKAADASLAPDRTRAALKSTRQSIAQLEARCAAAAEVRKRGAYQQQRQRLLEEMEAQNRLLARLRRELSKRKQLAGGETELANLRGYVDQRAATLMRQLEELAPGLAELHVPLSISSSSSTSSNATVAVVAHTTAANVTRRRGVKEGEVGTARTALAALEQRRALLEHKKSTTMEELVSTEAELAAMLEACSAVLLSPDSSAKETEKLAVSDVDAALDHYESTLAEAKTQAEAAVCRLHTLEAMSHCYCNFVEVAQAANKCATCDRTFDSADACAKFVSANRERQQTSPAAMEAARTAASAATARVEAIDRVGKSVGDVRRLRAIVPSLNERAQALSTELEQCATAQAEASERVEALRVELQSLDRVAARMAGLVVLEGEIADARSRLAVRERQLADIEKELSAKEDSEKNEDDDDDNRRKSYEELEVEYEHAQEHHHNLSVQLDEEQRMRLEEADGDTSVEGELAAKRTELYQLELAMAKLDDLEAALQNLKKESETHQARLNNIMANRIQLDRSLEATNAAVAKVRASRHSAEEIARATLDAAEQKLRALEGSVPKVLQYVRAGGARALQVARDELARMEKTHARHAQEVCSLTSEIEETRQAIAQHVTREVQVRRQIEVLEVRCSLEEDAALLADVEKTLRELKSGAGGPQEGRMQSTLRILGEGAENESLPKLREMIRAKISELERFRAQQQGNVEAMLQDMSALKAQLAKDKYQNIEKRYRSTFLKVQTTEITVKDIDKYYSVLEKAVQSYHQEKIKQINQIIGDLWRQTYRGSDIDTIEIRSETENTTTTAARRSYNYRVVMKRGDTELDMRGRCSAGQKVLASVIIRLALSEAFCCECGILALDEPTTNLDEDNARALAEALRVLIETRRTVKHFQLVVITHDEQFVRALGGQGLDFFYYVHKDREGAFSVVEKRTFNQLFA